MVDTYQLQRMLSGMQDQLTNFEKLVKNTQNMVQNQSFLPQKAQQLSAPQEPSAQQGMLLKMYDEFAKENEDDAKALAAVVNKFGRYLQGKAAKATPPQQ